MRIFLSLRNPYLCLFVGCQEFAKGIGDTLLLKRNQLVLDGLIIIRKAYIHQVQPFLPWEAVKAVVAECTGNLPCTVRAEVEENHGILILNRSHRLAVLHNHKGNHKLIRLPVVIGSLDAAGSAGRRVALTLCQRVVSQLHAVPSLITVHGIVTSHDRRYLAYAELLHLCFQLLHKAFS